jgi:hypothetical protein
VEEGFCRLVREDESQTDLFPAGAGAALGVWCNGLLFMLM